MAAIQKIAYWLVPLIIFAILFFAFYGGEGALTKIRGLGEDIKEAAPNVSVGLEGISAEDIMLGGELDVQFDSFQNTVNMMLSDPNKTNCFATFGGFDDLGSDKWLEQPESVTFVLNYNKQKNVTIVTVANDKGQYKQIYNLSMKPCVIAGVKGGSVVADNFFDHYIFQEASALKTPYYSSVDTITIYYSDKGLDGNAIRVSGEGFTDGEDPVNDEGHNLQDGGYLYKADGNNICFIPTNDVTNANKDGIEEQWIMDKNRDAPKLSSIAFGLECDGRTPKPCNATVRTPYDVDTAITKLQEKLDENPDAKYSDYPCLVDTFHEDKLLTYEEYKEVNGQGWFNLEGKLADVMVILEAKQSQNP